jgi:hypothetical protein
VANLAISRHNLSAAALVGMYGASVTLMPSPLYSLALSAPLLLLLLVWWTIAESQRWLWLFFAGASLLPPLPYALGDSGPHPAILLAALGVFAAVLRLGEWRFVLDEVSAALLVFTGIMLATVGLAALYSGIAIASASLARVLLFGVACLVFLYTVHGPRAGTDRIRSCSVLLAIGVAAALFACVDFYFQFPAPAGYGPQFVWLDSGVFRRAQGLFYEASTLGNFCAFFLVMIAVALFNPRDRRPCSRTALVAAGVIFSTALIFSYSRGSLLNVAIALCALAYVRRVRLKRAIVTMAACALISGAVVYLLFPSFAQSYWIRLAASFQYFWSSPEGILSGRVANWRILTAFLTAHPWHALFGIGYKTLPYSDFIGGAVIADNMYLSLLVETGVLGLGAFLLLNAAMLRAALRAARSSTRTAAFFGTWFFCFWAGETAQMFSGDLLTYWRVLPLYFWVLGVAVREMTHEDSAG